VLGEKVSAKNLKKKKILRIYSCCRCRCAAPQLLCIFISQSQAGLWCHDIVGVVAGSELGCVPCGRVVGWLARGARN
jgi:hypothetical protein